MCRYAGASHHVETPAVLADGTNQPLSSDSASSVTQTVQFVSLFAEGADTGAAPAPGGQPTAMAPSDPAPVLSLITDTFTFTYTHLGVGMPGSVLSDLQALGSPAMGAPGSAGLVGGSGAAAGNSSSGSVQAGAPANRVRSIPTMGE